MADNQGNVPAADANAAPTAQAPAASFLARESTKLGKFEGRKQDRKFVAGFVRRASDQKLAFVTSSLLTTSPAGRCSTASCLRRLRISLTGMISSLAC